RLAVEQPPGAERGFHLRAEIVGLARQSGEELNLALDARIDRPGLRDVDRGGQVRLPLLEVAVKPGRAVPSGRLEIGEAEAAARRRARGAGEREFAADDLVEER